MQIFVGQVVIGYNHRGSTALWLNSVVGQRRMIACSELTRDRTSFVSSATGDPCWLSVLTKTFWALENVNPIAGDIRNPIHKRITEGTESKKVFPTSDW